MGRAPALLGLTAALVAWYELAPRLAAFGTWGSAVLVAVVLMPAAFSATLLALPASTDRRLLALAFVVALALLAALSAVGEHIGANLAKFAAVTTAGWLFLTIFEALSWVVSVALVIPWVDAYSVWRGPTKTITTSHPNVFGSLSIAFVVPGGGAARLGLPDVMFFALFLAAASRFGLRVGATWAGMLVGLGATMILTTVWQTSGLPALPGIAFGFLLPNADLIWKGARGQAVAAAEASDG